MMILFLPAKKVVLSECHLILMMSLIGAMNVYATGSVKQLLFNSYWLNCVSTGILMCKKCHISHCSTFTDKALAVHKAL